MEKEDLTKRQKAGRGLPPRDRVRLENDIERNADVGSKQAANWIADAVRVTAKVAAGDIDLIPVFRIRLYGILDEVFTKLMTDAQFWVELGFPPRRDIAQLTEAIKQLAAVFTPDELIYIQYLRHTECHPLQDAYRIKITEAGKFKDTVTHHLIDQRLTVEETDAAIVRVLRGFKNDEHAIAHHLARKAAAPLMNVQLTSRPWFGLPH